MKCPRCNLINPETALRCDCGWDFKLGAVNASYLGVEDVFQGRLASLSERFLGQLFDSIIAGVIIVVGFVIAFVIGGISEDLAPLSVFGGAIVAILYLIFADGLSGGQSYGKRVMNTAVIDASSGQPCTFLKSLIRNILLSLLGIIDWIFIFGKNRQRLGDMAANTVVIKLQNR